MVKKTIEDSKSKDSEIDFKYNDQENQLRKKKIKLENKKIVKSKKLTKI